MMMCCVSEAVRRRRRCSVWVCGVLHGVKWLFLGSLLLLLLECNEERLLISEREREREREREIFEFFRNFGILE